MVANIYLGDNQAAFDSGKKWDLAIVDPPYGIGHSMLSGASRGSKFDRYKDNVSWDLAPNQKYFDELFGVSQNQIIWGANYFGMTPTKCILIWDKMQEFSGSDFELAWTNFDKPSKAFRMSRVEAYSCGKIHTCQKPVALYKWLLKNYAKEGDTILDTHGGSMSIVLACIDLGFDIDVWELDPDYYAAAKKRIQNHISQLPLFGEPPVINFYE
jgi:site-specific DNA-methyltransferase (adenine-specific)